MEITSLILLSRAIDHAKAFVSDATLTSALFASRWWDRASFTVVVHHQGRFLTIEGVYLRGKIYLVLSYGITGLALNRIGHPLSSVFLIVGFV